MLWITQGYASPLNPEEVKTLTTTKVKTVMACNKNFAILKSVKSLQYPLATSYARDISLTELISDNKVVVNNS